MRFRDIATFQLRTRLVHGPGSLEFLPKELKSLGVKRPWIITDQGIEKAGILTQVTDLLEKGGFAFGVFKDVGHIASVEDSIRSWNGAVAWSADGIIAVGGGTVLVLGKATGAMMGTGKSIREYAWEMPERSIPVIAIPTTAGSGAEVNPNMPMVDKEHRIKLTVTSPECYPKVAILDPFLLKTLPYFQAICSGVDALTHSIEACWTTFGTPLTDTLALGGLKILMNNLRTACRTDDIEAKDACLLGSAMANMACQNTKLGFVHGLARNVQTLFNVTYGVTIGVMLTPVMEFNVSAAPERFSAMAEAMGVARRDLPLRVHAEAAVSQVKTLLADLEFPRRFGPEQVDRNAIPKMVKMVYARASDRYLTDEELEQIPVEGYAPSPNIRKATYQDLISLYEKAMEGWKI